MAHDALEVVKLRRDFYRDSYRLIVVALFVTLVIIAILASSLVYLLTHRPAPQYFATTRDGRLIKMVALDQPNLTNQAVLLWVSNAVTSLYTYDFVNYRATFQSNSQYFTKDGWRAFLSILNASQNLQAVKDKKLVVTAVPSGAPVILEQSVNEGVYFWRVQIPIVVTYTSLSQQFTQNLLLTLLVQRLPTLENTYGIGIAQFVAQQQ